jgi:hypothetical protein
MGHWSSDTKLNLIRPDGALQFLSEAPMHHGLPYSSSYVDNL